MTKQALQSPDQAFVGREIQDAIFEEREISETAARIIASWWHSGPTSAFYRFASTGAIDRSAVTDEFVLAYGGQLLGDFDRLALDYLGGYLLNADGVDEHGNRGPVAGWDKRTAWSEV